ncbi:gas vesicle protein GvpG [Streptantibioticus rubrisoli]|uniref:Gas vesicle protein GvpG n=1 Tax=Streptantibioticus rubrisoli TaxID=1387313 RepID=A0ABT1PHK8_9ACTN|nr:gas vesicle protein GvpG [Streptantibioticus rubrisoli]MCQ4043723.1 gas vesicle protein GvpG [Streptantibioticus rubrisoli]
MGLVTRILTLPFAPVEGTVWVIDQLVLAAERQCYDPAPLRRQLAELERQLIDGRIDEAEFDRREDELLDQIEWLEARRRGSA